MPDDDTKRAEFRALADRVRDGDGRAPAEQRARAFGNDGLSAPLDRLIGRVAARPPEVAVTANSAADSTAGFGADFTAAKAAGFSEDQLFELVICAAVGQSDRLYEAGLAALAEATSAGEPDNAT